MTDNGPDLKMLGLAEDYCCYCVGIQVIELTYVGSCYGVFDMDYISLPFLGKYRTSPSASTISDDGRPTIYT